MALFFQDLAARHAPPRPATWPRLRPLRPQAAATLGKFAQGHPTRKKILLGYLYGVGSRHAGPLPQKRYKRARSRKGLTHS